MFDDPSITTWQLNEHETEITLSVLKLLKAISSDEDIERLLWEACGEDGTIGGGGPSYLYFCRLMLSFST